ncbi:sensor histidine kinase [Peteryoungia desertarenae]|nr:HAMP domain-containing sensor histidine kinase [Peteryoungia desertarenae]
MTAMVDRLAQHGLPRDHHDGACSARVTILLRHLARVFAIALIAVPAGLAFVWNPAIALPIGFALVAVLYMLSALAIVAVHRVGLSTAGESADRHQPAPMQDLLDFCPGLFLQLDAMGAVRQTGGRDRDMFLSFLREPFERPFVEQVHVSDRIRFIQALDQLRQGVDAVLIDLRLDRPILGLDHTQFMNIRLDMTARRDADGMLEGVLAQMLDIEGEMEIRAAVSAKESEAAEAHEAKSRFLAAVSHELRTPLNAILGFSDILAGEYFGKLENDRQREYVQLIRQSGAHLLSVVNTMLDMSKIEAGRYELMLETFPVAETIVGCEQMLSLQATSKGVKLTSRLPRALGDITADPRALRQIIINLVSNAVKFTDAGGAVTIDASLRDNRLAISVSDTGIGIAADKIEALGRPFMQIHNDLNRNYEGSGLGLSLVKGLTALHGGSFAIESRPGEGTVVTVSLPVDGSGAAAQAAMSDNMVEFPPRLLAVEPASRESGKETVNGKAKAKIA